MTTPSTATAVPQPRVLQAAQAGDQDAFGRLVEPYQGELLAHCYRMLGSMHDAEDAMQDASLRAWRALARFEGRSSLRSWLYTIATNTCLSHIERRPKRVLPIDYGAPTYPHDGPGRPLVESVWVEPCPDEVLGLADGRAAPEARYELRDSVEPAFVAALQRACATVDDKLPERSRQATLRELGDERVQELVQGYMEAMAGGDVDTVVSMLAADAAWSMPPLATWFRGHGEVREFLSMYPLSGTWRWRHVGTSSNGQPAIGAYTWREDQGCFLPFALDVLTLEADRIKEVTAFITRSAVERDREAFVRYPDEPIDARKVAAVFERAGLPGRPD